MTDIKQCKKCHFLKTVDQFYKRTDTPNGYRNTCKECHKQYEVDNKEKIRARHHSYTKAGRNEKAEASSPRNIFRRAITWILSLISIHN